MQCRYCGRDIKPLGSNVATSYGLQCSASPTKKHVGVSDGTHCVYCGRQTRTLGSGLITEYGQRCSASPSGTHALQ
ncbi:MAG: hypothetical protein ACTTJ7_00820 [Treponema sp.]